MTKEQHNWFEKLSKKRNNTAITVMNNFAIGNIWNSVVEKYSDQAHFIYELLQNANDTKATKSFFKLRNTGLFFIHNGRKNFWVSNPENEKEDQQKNKLGDINAITAVAQSNKKDQSTIGKFGVGFKAVFQYTDTPHIYDPNFQFKIVKFIVPIKLKNDLGGRIPNETVFFFPFDKKEMTAENAYSDILNKLKNIVYPTLFLSNLQDVKWESDNESGEYTKRKTEHIQEDDIVLEKYELYQKIGINQTKEKLYLFTRFTEKENLGYSIGYFLDEHDKLIPKQLPAFCFFPTKETTNLNFILHAPFLLTDSREGIKSSENHNTEMIELLSQLSADSLLILKDLKLINDDIFEIIPYKKPQEDDFFAPFYEIIKEKFENEELLPSKDGSYAKKANAYWGAVSKLTELFSNEQLTDIFEDEETGKWVFASKGRNEILRGDKELCSYIDSITNTWLDESDILIGGNKNGIKQKSITSDFIEKQNDEWLYSFYKWISDTEGRKKLVRDKPFFLNQDRKAVPVYDLNHSLKLFLPDNDGEGYDTLNTDIFRLTNEILLKELKAIKSKQQEIIEEELLPAKEFFEKFDIRYRTVADEIDEAIIRFKNDQLSAEPFFAKAFKYFANECPQNEIDEFIGRIKDLLFIPYYNKDGNIGTSKGSNLCYPTEKLVEFYEEITDTKFVDIEKLKKKYPNEHLTLDNFLKQLGVDRKDPELKDRVYKLVIPKFQKDGQVDTRPGFKDLFKYYQVCKNQDIDLFILILRHLNFISSTSKSDSKPKLAIPSDLYYPSEDLEKYFETKPDTKFVAIEYYHSFITGEKQQQILKEFLLKLGVSELPRIIERNIRHSSIKQKLNLEQSTYGYEDRNTTTDKIIDGCNEILSNMDIEKSLILWRILNQLPKHLFARGEHEYFYRSHKYQYFESTTLTSLKTNKWILSNQNEFFAPHEITINELSDDYEKEDSQAKELIELLKFKPLVILSKAERIAQKFENEEEAELAKKLLEQHKAKEKAKINSNHTNNETGNDSSDKEQTKTSRIERTINDLRVLQDEFPQAPQNTEKENGEPESKPDINFDEDAEFAKGIEDLKVQLELKKSRVDLKDNISNSKKYSYDWFKAYLQLLTTYGEKQDTTKQKSISFSGIKPYKTDNKYFLLCGASTYIYPEIENADDFNITLVFGNGKKENINVEGVSKKGQDLLIYCRESMPSNTLSRLSNTFKVMINFTPVIDLLDRLYRAFTNSNYIDEWQNIKEAMPPLDYIYGPPGTGKTTTLCNSINVILKKYPNEKILVLTPTNKAGDMVCKKLRDINSNIYAVRLSRPTDPELEEEAIYRDTLNDADMRSIDVVTSTIHRLPYFDIQNIGLLFQNKWDYVIFDESSMTGLHYITFAIMALFKTNPDTTFIVSGDPKQIPPVVGIDEKELESFDFQDENIYKMMNLESFNPNEQSIREIDTIKNLKTQYRSIPKIGQLFSELSYSSLLKHDRATNRTETKSLPEKFKSIISSNVTFIDIPLNKDNSIYKIKKLLYSSYHTYCAILVSEIVKYFDTVNECEQWTIGLIAPYKAQAILLNKLVTSYGISDNLKVYSDTVHGFQGDECDIVFFVCNPNNYYYSGHEKALLSKEYIYNVAISRAKDYLVVLHPYSTISNPFVNSISNSYKNNFGNAVILNTQNIERILFDDENYIENNSYVSGHDSVNVFGLSEMKYFIKSNDTAIDIQLRDLTTNNHDNGIQKEKIFQPTPPKLEGLKILGKWT